MNKRLSRRIHISWHIAWLSIGFVIGVAVCQLLPVWAMIGIEGLVIAGSLLLIVFARKMAVMILLSLVAGLLMGAWRGSIEQTALLKYEPFYSRVLSVRGVVKDDVSQDKHGDQQIRLGNVVIDDQHLPASIWISTPSKLDIKRGDVVTLKGKLDHGFGNMPASMFRATMVSAEHPVPGDVALMVRDWFADAIRRAIPEPESSLGVGYLVGQKSALPETLEQQLQTVGLTHVVVASGYNLTILVAFARRALARFSKYLATLSASFMIAGFIMITGFSPSMSRAGLVSGLSLAAWYYGRNIHPLVILPFAAAITLIINPSYIWGDIGWYLSFSAFAGILIIAPLIHHYFWGNAIKPNAFRQLIIETGSAQLATMPVILATFGSFAIYALPANILVLPLVPIAMLLTFAAGIISVTIPVVAHVGGLPATFLLRYSMAVVRWFASMPGASSELTFGIRDLVLCYIVIICCLIILCHKTRHDFKRNNIFDSA